MIEKERELTLMERVQTKIKVRLRTVYIPDILTVQDTEINCCRQERPLVDKKFVLESDQSLFFLTDPLWAPGTRHSLPFFL